MTVGPIEATLLAISRELDELGGYAMTRTTLVVSKGATVWPVESTLEFQSSGSFVARGTLYTYLSKTPVTLEGVQFTDGITVFNGAKIDLREEITITDFSRARTAIDLVNFAEGVDLVVVGSNLGVPRFPGVSDDDTYRAVIKALAYNPRGTIFGIETLLNALLGAGNFAIFEDLVSRPNEIFIELLGTALLNAEFAGKAFFHPRVLRPADSATQVTIAGAPPIITPYSVIFKDADHTSDFRTALPSAETLVEFPGDAGTPVWTFVGTSEGTNVTQQGTGIEDGSIRIDDIGVIAVVTTYQHNARIQGESDALFGLLMSVSSSGTVDASAGLQWAAQMRDGERILAWGIVSNGGNYDLGFITSAGAFISGAAATLTKDVIREIEIRKCGRNEVQLLIDGSIVQSIAHSSFSATTDTDFRFGCFSTTTSGLEADAKQTGYYARTPTDYWASRGTTGEAFPAATTDKTFEDTTATPFLSGDVGKRVTIAGSAVSNPQSGNNNGIFEVDTFTSTSRVTLKGSDKTDGMVETATPTVFDANDINAFQFPDDLGKEIVISGAANPANNGTFVITDLLSESDGITPLSSAALAATYTWNGTSTVTTSDTSEVAVGALIRLDSDGQFFTITSITTNVDVTISNPLSLTIPSGSTQSSRGRPGVLPERTGIAIALSATFVSESELSWRLDPVFINETALDWELSDTGTEAAGVLTLRQSLPTLSGGVTRILEIGYTDVLSAQLLLDASVVAAQISAGPPVTLDKYGFYLADPLGVVRRYLDIITVAGVIPDVLER